ncbi:hypothetical protein CEUSTIGMA_g6531.t1 [Chlamydomonas eustigma]|uniref:Uncharacterized protein n=1 Tax=Chlamydomonas eustigma TaxID=1157962 RepID=A0A250X7M6_9CHLO|nr:hypothetical protein CEUSTIGMA_g6531.t1 [Chlamydomonas eustigma]|eukprot:GAX79091.1 hypothetical protein CEUSTIGMA_g6531.t1 [Chlamydomonas eustigma]
MVSYTGQTNSTATAKQHDWELLASMDKTVRSELEPSSSSTPSAAPLPHQNVEDINLYFHKSRGSRSVPLLLQQSSALLPMPVREAISNTVRKLPPFPDASISAYLEASGCKDSVHGLSHGDISSPQIYGNSPVLASGSLRSRLELRRPKTYRDLDIKALPDLSLLMSPRTSIRRASLCSSLPALSTSPDVSGGGPGEEQGEMLLPRHCQHVVVEHCAQCMRLRVRRHMSLQSFNNQLSWQGSTGLDGQREASQDPHITDLMYKDRAEQPVDVGAPQHESSTIPCPSGKLTRAVRLRGAVLKSVSFTTRFYDYTRQKHIVVSGWRRLPLLPIQASPERAIWGHAPEEGVDGVDDVDESSFLNYKGDNKSCVASSVTPFKTLCEAERCQNSDERIPSCSLVSNIVRSSTSVVLGGQIIALRN